MFAVDKNDLMDDWTHVCNQVGVGFLSADCGGKFQEVFCKCCTVCCQDKDPECNDDLVYSKLDEFTRTAHDFGPNQVHDDAATNAGTAEDEETNGAESGDENRDFLRW